MVNINGYGNGVGKTAATPQEYGSKGKNAAKANGKSNKHTDVADFSSVMKNTENEKTYSPFKVSSASEKTDGLSQKAKDYLEKLKKKYGNMDFIVADFSSDEEADNLLGKGKGEYNVLLTPDLLEKMAADEDTAAEYEGLIEQSVEDIKQAKESLGEDADMVQHMGVSVDSEGNVTYHAKLIDALTNNKDGGKASIKANTIDELLENLKAAKEENAEKLAKIRKEKAEAVNKAAEKLEENQKKFEDKSDELSQFNRFNAEA